MLNHMLQNQAKKYWKQFKGMSYLNCHIHQTMLLLIIFFFDQLEMVFRSSTLNLIYALFKFLIYWGRGRGEMKFKKILTEQSIGGDKNTICLFNSLYCLRLQKKLLPKYSFYSLFNLTNRKLLQ